MKLLLLALSLALPVRAEELPPRAVSEGLPVIARLDAFGLGAEAAWAAAWLRDRPDAQLSAGGLISGAERLALTPAFARVLQRLGRFVALEDEARANPVSFEELRAAFLSPAGVALARGLFDEAMAGRMKVSGRSVIPEIGGEAVLDGELVFHRLDDPLRPVLRELLARRADPEGLRRLFTERPKEMAALDPYSTLRKHLETRRRWDAEDKVPKARRDEILAMAIDDLAQVSVDTFTMGAKEELEATLGRDWSGRYLGHWHLHPPDAGKTGWESSVPPSPPDYDRAAENGREIVIVFISDGFDVHDLGKGTERAFSYRGEDWRLHFQSVFDAL